MIEIYLVSTFVETPRHALLEVRLQPSRGIVSRIDLPRKHGSIIALRMALALQNSFRLCRSALPLFTRRSYAKRSKFSSPRSDAASSFSVEETVNGSEITVELKDVPDDASAKFVERDPSRCTLCTCNVPVKIKYTDVLVLEQFMREDGTVLPKELTGKLIVFMARRLIV